MPVEEVLAVHDDLFAVPFQKRHGLGDHRQVLGGVHAEHLLALLLPRLGYDADARRGARDERPQALVVFRGDAAAPGHAKRREGHVLRLGAFGEPAGEPALEELDVLGVRAGVPALDVPHAERHQMLRHGQLVVAGERDAHLLRPVAKRCVVQHHVQAGVVRERGRRRERGGGLAARRSRGFAREWISVFLRRPDRPGRARREERAGGGERERHGVARGVRARVGCAARVCGGVGRDGKPLRWFGSKKQQKAALFACQIFVSRVGPASNGRDARRLITEIITRTDGESFEGGRVMIFPDGHSDPRTWHTPSPLETRRCVERRASLSHRARLSLANATSASRGTHGPTDCGADQHGTRSTQPAAWTGGRVVISRTETSAEPARAASDRRPTPRSPSRVTRHDRLHHG